jgi:hypothetical protein
MAAKPAPRRKGSPPPLGDTLGAIQPLAEKPAIDKKAKAKPAKTAAVPKAKAKPAAKAKAAPKAKPAAKAKAKPAARAKPVAKAPSKERAEPLNFRVTGEFRRAFKRAAAAQDCKKVELLERIFEEWSARNPG